MKELKFSSGVVTYSLNGECEVSFNPGDTEFVERFHAGFEEIAKIQDEYSKTERPETPGKEIFEIARNRDNKIKEIIDGIFNKPVSAALFENVSPCAYADGLPIWVNLMLSILDEIDANIDDIEKKADPRISKYTEKYGKYAKKRR